MVSSAAALGAPQQQQQQAGGVGPPLVAGEPLAGRHLGQLLAGLGLRAVGAAVRRNWPDEGGWFNALITEYKPELGMRPRH